MTITLRQLRAATFVPVYDYAGRTRGFTVFAAGDMPGLTVTHDRLPGSRVRITYRVDGRTTDSPSQVVRMWNEKEKKRADCHI